MSFTNYRPGPGAVDPPGIGEGISLAEPCVLVAFRRGVVLTVPVVLVVAGVVVEPVCWQDARNAMPITIAIRESSCFFIRHTSRGARSLVVLKCNELLDMMR
jgi:hypothetical protein